MPPSLFTTALATTLVVLLTVTSSSPRSLMTVADAACTGSDLGPGSETVLTETCTDCLSIEGCNAWVPGQEVGSGECFPSCMDGPQDVACFTNSTLGEESTIESVCEVSETAQSDAELCTSEGGESCEDCTSVTLSDGFSTCLWFSTGDTMMGGEPSGFCSNQCGMDGCGVATCDELDNGPGGGEDEGPGMGGTNCTALSSSCAECLEMQCAWLGTGAGCISGCDIIADVKCYDQTTFPDLDETESCEAVVESEAEDMLCDSQTDCTSCVSTTLSSGSTCRWNEEFSFCSSGATQVGPGTTECSIPDDTPPASGSTTAPDPDSSCEMNSGCEECLGSSCAWAPVAGCLPSCSVIADASCYSLESSPTSTTRQNDGVETPESVCAVAANNTADSNACSSQEDCGSCVGTVLSDGVSTCKWYGTYCSSLACDMTSCGSDTCEPPSGSLSRSSPFTTVLVSSIALSLSIVAVSLGGL
eukprot:CAMPEP_0113453468 /NCGR_PEP_ID=MMETSP0014_2-20120614/7371_1 /TAXON_ID=2857 /ORGANISM="Nitzschia sp." /LENGTH=473 /DNA_ID=CAMNT_0000344859 /DNA_START=302 /DNA_END=1723 /DNA_ORIENTATION=- /assembly_acc=CAM_ASM_000159